MIEVTHDKEPSWAPKELCAFCHRPTRYWYTPKDVAVCAACAETHSVEDVPSKRDWLVSNGAKLPKDWKCNADMRANAVASMVD